MGKRLLRSHAEIEDFTQEVLLRAYTGRARLRDPERIRPWLIAIARHTAFEWGRRHDPHPLSDLPDARAGAHGADQLIEDRETHASVRRGLTALRVSDRELLRAFYFDEVGYEDPPNGWESRKRRWPSGSRELVSGFATA